MTNHTFNTNQINFFLNIFSFLLSSEKDKVFNILKEVRERLKKENITLTSSFALTLDERPFDKSDFLKYSQQFDYIQYKELVVDEKFQKFPFEHMLSEVNPSSVQNKILKFIAWGVAPSKILMAVDFGGPVAIGEAKNIDYFNYCSICDMMMHDKSPKMLHSYDNSSGLATLDVIDDENIKYHIYYSTSRIIANHMRFAVQNKLAGILGDLLQNDDVTGGCFVDTDTFDDFKTAEGIKLKIPEGKKGSSLMRTINEALVVSVEEVSQMNKVQTILTQNFATQGNSTVDSQETASFVSQQSPSVAAHGNPNSQNSTSGGNITTTGAASCFTNNPFHLAFVVMAIALSSIIVSI